MTPWDWRDKHVMSSAGPSSPTVRYVLCALASDMRRDFVQVRPGLGALAVKTGHSERTVSRALGEAVRAGWLRVVKPATQHTPATYEPALPAQGGNPVGSGAVQGRQEERPGWTKTTPRVDKTSPLLREKEKEREERLCPDCSSPIQKKTGSRGEFLSCSAYPKCRWSESIKSDMAAAAKRAAADAETTRRIMADLKRRDRSASNGVRGVG